MLALKPACSLSQRPRWESLLLRVCLPRISIPISQSFRLWPDSEFLPCAPSRSWFIFPHKFFLIATGTECRGFVFIASSSSYQLRVVCRHHTKHLSCINPLNPHKRLPRQILSFFSTLPMSKRGSERGSGLPRVTQGVNGSAMVKCASTLLRPAPMCCGTLGRGGLPAVPTQRPFLAKGHLRVITSHCSCVHPAPDHGPMPASPPPTPPVLTLAPSLLSSGQAC